VSTIVCVGLSLRQATSQKYRDGAKDIKVSIDGVSDASIHRFLTLWLVHTYA